jgi:hypothetical protein
MIGVIANPTEHEVVREFFELFKTPWEFYESNRQYDVVLCSGDCDIPETSEKFVLAYAGKGLSSDAHESKASSPRGTIARILSYQGYQIPIYGNSVTFREGIDVLVDEECHESAVYVHRSCSNVVVRIGYDLFAEIRVLLMVGQPAIHADIPAIELHIALLRYLIVRSGVPLVEIPPVPDGYQFIACLTHDVDHPSLRRHVFDHTMFGFLYRAIIGSLMNIARGRRPARVLLSNLLAALKLPFVHLGLATDFWYAFDRYIWLEKGSRSTFFVIPFKELPGRTPQGQAPKRRASSYAAVDISPKIHELISAGCEIGLHGIDAWVDSSSGCREVAEIRRITGASDIGSRMHWLYFDEDSPGILENAGVDYDCTVGYNETVGYRAGTTQAFKPLQATRLLELPLHIMDTALFYPNHLDLSPKEAAERVRRIVDNAVQLGGCVTVNWHDRSIAPERCWGDFYSGLVSELKCRGAWFATAAETVSWFRKRRSAVFENVNWELGGARVKVTPDHDDRLPGLRLCVHKARVSSKSGADSLEGFGDIAMPETADSRISVSRSHE